MEIKVNAVVLRTVDYNENDKILTLLTAERGKITAGIKGVKKAAAKLKFAAQPFCFAEYILVGKGGKYTVTGATETESFYDLRTDILRFYAASAVTEAANAISFEGDASSDLFTATVRALSEICSGEVSPALIKFLTTVLKGAGYNISVENCPYCGKSLLNEERLRFDMNIGSFTCADCGSGEGASAVTYNVFRKIFDKSYKENYITEDGEKRALRLIREYFSYKLDIAFKSLSEYIRLI